jgi:hypothetical protein
LLLVDGARQAAALGGVGVFFIRRIGDEPRAARRFEMPRNSVANMVPTDHAVEMNGSLSLICWRFDGIGVRGGMFASVLPSIGTLNGVPVSFYSNVALEVRIALGRLGGMGRPVSRAFSARRSARLAHGRARRRQKIIRLTTLLPGSKPSRSPDALYVAFSDGLP